MTRKSTEGFVLPMVVIALAMMGVLLVAILATSNDDRESAVVIQEGARSFYAAEAGLNQVVAQWADSNYDTLIPAAGNSDTFATRTIPENGAHYRAIISRLAASGPYSLTVDGRSPAPRSGLRTVSMILNVTSSFKYAVLGNNDLIFTKGGTDSWDSALGAYGGLNISLNGDVFSNGSISQLSGTALIRGSVTAHTTIQATGCTRVTGTCTAGAPQIPVPPVSCPAGYSPASDIPTGPAITYNAATGALAVGNTSTLTLNYANSPFRFSNVTFTKASILTFTGTPQHVDIYISGTLDLGGGSFANPTGKPANLTIWGCGGDTSTWILSGGTSAFYAVYAPNHPITLSGGSAIYGAVVGASVNNSGGSMIHYDKALARTGAVTPLAGSWTEVQH